jgi:hypothetical protein
MEKKPLREKSHQSCPRFWKVGRLLANMVGGGLWPIESNLIAAQCPCSIPLSIIISTSFLMFTHSSHSHGGIIDELPDNSIKARY